MGLSNLTKKFLICAFSLCTVSSFAQEVKEEGKVVFNPHWFMQIQGGASHTLGEASFSLHKLQGVTNSARYLVCVPE